MSRKATVPREMRVAVAVTVIAFGLMFSASAFAVDNTLMVGIDGHYSLMGRRAGTGVNSLQGGGVGGHIVYSLTDTWRLSLSGGHAWYQSYVFETEAAPDDGGDPDIDGDEEEDDGIIDEDTEEEAPQISISALQVSSLALSVEYLVDIMRVLPFFALGVVATRTYEEVDPSEVEDAVPVRTATYEMGYRISLGFDYMLLGYLGVGMVLRSDNYITEASGYLGRLSVLVRATFCFDMGKFGLCRPEN